MAVQGEVTAWFAALDRRNDIRHRPLGRDDTIGYTVVVQ